MNKKLHIYECLKVTSAQKKEKRRRKEKIRRKEILSSAMSNTTAGKTSSFSVTCNLLSQFIKEKGRSPLDLNLARSIDASMGKIDVTTHPRPSMMNLLTGVDVSETDSKNKVSGQTPEKSMDLFPQLVGFGTKEDDKREQENRQLTIFYAGKVLVYDNFPTEKANDLMTLALKGSAATNDPPVPAPPVPVQPITLGAETKIVFSTPPSVQTILPPRPVQTVTSDLPIARKASLHRFLEKRKDRVNARVPYHQVNKAKDSAAENQPWLGLSSECSK